MSVLRRYEILLPSQFNDGRHVPEELLAQSLIELEQQFGAVSCETQHIQGFWQQRGEHYHDQLVRVFVDVPDNAVNREFFLLVKERLKSRFQQIDIWMTTYLVEVL